MYERQMARSLRVVKATVITVIAAAAAAIAVVRQGTRYDRCEPSSQGREIGSGICIIEMEARVLEAADAFDVAGGDHHRHTKTVEPLQHPDQPEAPPVSRFAVYSSAINRSGRPVTARATPTRRCSSPDSVVGRPDQAQQRGYLLPHLALRSAGERNRQGAVVEGGEMRGQPEFLEDDTDALPKRSPPGSFRQRRIPREQDHDTARRWLGEGMIFSSADMPAPLAL